MGVPSICAISGANPAFNSIIQALAEVQRAGDSQREIMVNGGWFALMASYCRGPHKLGDGRRIESTNTPISIYYDFQGSRIQPTEV